VTRVHHDPRLPRLLHPAAWWAWAIGLAMAASRTTNPLLLALIVAVAGYVVASRREVGAASPFGAFLRLGLFVIAMRIVLVALLGGGVPGQTVLFTLPEIPLPTGATGVRLGGEVTLEGVLAAAYDGARLAAILACIGAANALASPRRLLRYVPATLYEVGTALVVALTFAGTPGAVPESWPGWPSPSWTAPWSAPWISPRPWSPAGTAARCTATTAPAAQPLR